MNLKEFLKDNSLIMDGAFGTYYNSLYDNDELPEIANIHNKERVINIHREYIRAGAKLIRTNTFASNSVSLECDLKELKTNIVNAISLAKIAVEESRKEGFADTFIAASIGPIPFEDLSDREAIEKEYLFIAKTFVENGVKIFDFETFDTLEYIKEAIDYLKDYGEIMLSFCVNQYGYSNAGLSAKKLCMDAAKLEGVVATGFNCGVGPGHLTAIISKIFESVSVPIMALPNVGYPSNVSGRMVFANKNVSYYADKMQEIIKEGASIIGGCCGTSPKHIEALTRLNFSKPRKINKTDIDDNTVTVSNKSAFYYNKTRKLIAVELAPPFDGDDEKILASAFALKEKCVDVLTFPDSPSGRTRTDSILMASKINRETGMCVMPHVCCRDKNAIAIRSQLLGSYINDIKNFLVITGDPIPSVVRSSVKSVFNFDSVGFMNIIKDMNENQFKDSALVYGGAINQGRSNFNVELQRVIKKVEAGATFFFTQPIFSDEDVNRLEIIKKEVGKEIKILAGIMPFVSLKNATFMKNEMAGINVGDNVLQRYREDMTKEEGERVGIEIAREMIDKTKNFVDGYYFSFPFNRVYLLDEILN